MPGLEVIAESPQSGVCMVMARGGREIYITGHAEYSPYTLDTEYRRDLEKGLPIDMPVNYYCHNVHQTSGQLFSGGRSDEKTASAMACPFQQSLQQLAELLRVSGNSLRY